MEDKYLTIKAPAEGIFKDKGSKFMAFAYPVQSEEEIKSNIDSLRKKYFDARHYCFAWKIGDKFRAFDDGEPNHSAGDPILGQIRSKNLTNILVVVVRYFGGIKLGIGGLIAAYKAAAEDVIKNATLLEVEIKDALWLEYDYSSTAEVLRLVNTHELEITRQHFATQCLTEALVKKGRIKTLVEKLDTLKAMGFLVGYGFGEKT